MRKNFKNMGRHILIVLFFLPFFGSAQAREFNNPNGTLCAIEGEIMEIESLHQPLGAAVYKVKDFSTGQAIKLYADPYQTLVKAGPETQAVTDVVLGSKAKILYRAAPETSELPVMTFVKIRGSH